LLKLITGAAGSYVPALSTHEGKAGQGAELAGEKFVAAIKIDP
jgi:hypothetical protein